MSHLESLLTVAGEQRGYVTARDADGVGVPPVELRKMAARGVLSRKGHGLYRIDAFPVQRHDEFMEANLWAGGEGVTSHESALSLWELCDVNPRVINVTVPRRMRRASPTFYRLWINDLRPFDIDWHEGIRVTSPARSIADALDSGTRSSLIEQAIESALRYRLMDERSAKELRNRLDLVYSGKPRPGPRARLQPKLGVRCGRTWSGEI